MVPIHVLLVLVLVSFVHGSFYSIGGSNTHNQPSIYPPSTPLTVGSRWGAATWNRTGEMWMFGGLAQAGHLGDLWLFTTYNWKWTYIGGPKTADVYGVYTTQNGPAWPGTRYGAATFSDGTNLYLFGGNGFGASTQGDLNDLWKYTPATNTWTFIKGSALPGQSSVFSGINPVPGGRNFPTSWVDKKMKFYLFGGGTLYGYLNDMWLYNVSTNTWSFVSGSTTMNAPSTTSGTTSTPGARGKAVGWSDPVTGRIWLYGGYGNCLGTTGPNSGMLNEMWTYNGYGVWTLITGTINCDVLTDYTGLTPTPGGRESSLGWYDKARHQLLLFGGYGRDPSGSYGSFQDVWVYELGGANGLTWSYHLGATTVNHYGVYSGVGQAPGSRYLSMGVPDLVYDRFYLFGGAGYDATSNGILNDLWVFYY